MHCFLQNQMDLHYFPGLRTTLCSSQDTDDGDDDDNDDDNIEQSHKSISEVNGQNDESDEVIFCQPLMSHTN